MIAIFRWICVGLIIVSGAGLLYLSGQTLKTKLAWANKIRGHERRLSDLDTEVETLKLGEVANRKRVYSPGDPELNPIESSKSGAIGLRLTTAAADWWTRHRGRRWEATPTTVDAATGAAKVTITAPNPHQIGDKAFLYIFDARDKAEGGKYLGEFRVTAVMQDDMTNSIDVVPTDPLSAEELRTLTQNGGAAAVWHIYDKLPIDRYETFANAEDAINTLLPDSVKSQYLRHGQPAETTDPKENVDDGTNTYRRPLYDFMAIYRDLRAKLPVLRDKLLARTNDAASIEAALKLLIDPPPPAEATSGRIVERAKEITKLDAELVLAKADADKVAAELKKLETEVAAARAAVDEVAKQNKQLAAEIIKMQRDASARATAGTR